MLPLHKRFTFEVCAADRSGQPEIPLEAFHTLKPIVYHPREWVEPTDRGDERPQVINNSLIQEMYKKYSELPPEHVEVAANDHDIRFDDMKELKLEYLNILHIGNLEKCCNLKKLSLNNNIIETPVGLGSLVQLEELDLSHNKLTDLKSIHLLRKLRVLRLNNNLIQSIELLKYNHRCLEVLNLGYNKIADFPETLLYLTALPNLQSLSLDGNLFWGEGKSTDRFLKILLFYFIPQLRFYEHRIVTFKDCYPAVDEIGEYESCSNEEERRILIVKRLVNKFKNDDPGIVLRLDAIRTEILGMDINEEEANNKLALESILDKLCLAGFRYGKGFNALMEKDSEGQELMSISKRIKDEVFGRLEEAMEPVILDITRSGIAFFRSRQEIIDKYIKLWDNEAQNHEKKYNEVVQNFLEQENAIMERLLTSFNSDNSTELLAEKNMKEVLLNDKEFTILTKEIWWDLMDKEMTAHAKLEDLFETLDEELAEMIRVYSEPFQEKVVKLRKVEEEFFEYLMDFMAHYVNEMISNKLDRAKLSDNHRKILFNSETRNNIMTQCHDNHASFIDIEEEDAIELMRKWQLDIAESCRRIESENNRMEVDGIHKLIVSHKSSWDDKVGDKIKTAYTFLWVADPQWTKEMMYFKMNYEDRQLFDELESVFLKETTVAIEVRKEHERLKELAAIQEAERKAEIERKIQMRRLKGLAERQGTPLKEVSVHAVQDTTEKDKAKELAMKEIASLQQIDITYENLRGVVLTEESHKREARRKKREREWKTQSDVGRLVHMIAGKNLRVYQTLKEKILHSEDSDSG